MQENDPTDDAAMMRVREIWTQRKASGKMTQEELGMAMGYDQKSARKSVSQFFKTSDPRISMLRRFAKAMGLKISDIVK